MFTKGAKTFVAGEALARYRIVQLDTTADQVVYPASGGKGPYFVTCAAAANGNSVACVPLSAWEGTIKLTAAAAIALGAQVNVSGAAGKVDDAGQGAPLAVALEAASADGEEFEAVPFHGPDASTINADVANGTTLTDSVTETDLATTTIDGAALKAGDVLEVIFAATTPATNSTDTLTVKLYVGTEEIVTTGAVDVANDDVAFIHAFITIRTTGASGTLVATGHQILDASGTATKAFRKASATEDISGDVAIAVKGTWSVADAGNTVNSETFILKHHRAA